MNLGKPTAFMLVMAALLVIPIDRTQATELEVPRIYLVAPAADAPVTSPIHVALRFEAPSGSDIDLASFQVLYQFGIFKKDITKQILQFVTLTPAGLTGSTPPELPPGVHTLVVRIRDTQHRSGELMLSLRIGTTR
jgi:hypothetical protein